MRFGSLFSGIGGMDLGLERAGMTCAWQVEIDEFCRKVLTKHWPNVPKFNDVREVGKHNLEPVDLIAGGFPCQDISHAGLRIGIDGKRSGLWSEFARIIRELRPRLALVENVPALADRGMDRVLGDLARLGFDAEWFVLSACAFGAPHTRERMFILAYPTGEQSRQLRRIKCTPSGAPQRNLCWSQAEPPVTRVVDGTPNRLERLTGGGNAVVPQVAEWIGSRILDSI